jgi:hypothetical protein
MMAGNRWCERRSGVAPYPDGTRSECRGGQEERLSFAAKVAPGSIASTWNESPVTVTSQMMRLHSGSSSLTSFSGALPTVRDDSSRSRVEGPSRSTRSARNGASPRSRSGLWYRSARSESDWLTLRTSAFPTARFCRGAQDRAHARAARASASGTSARAARGPETCKEDEVRFPTGRNAITFLRGSERALGQGGGPMVDHDGFRRRSRSTAERISSRLEHGRARIHRVRGPGRRRVVRVGPEQHDRSSGMSLRAPSGPTRRFHRASSSRSRMQQWLTGSPRERVLVERGSHLVVDVDRVGHDPRGVDRAHMVPVLPVRVIEPGSRRRPPSARADRPPRDERPELVGREGLNAERLRG